MIGDRESAIEESAIGNRKSVRLSMLAIATLALAIAIVAAQTPTKRTTLDKVYTKEQAAKGEAQYAKVCASCHDPARVPAGKKPAPALTGDKFFDRWKDKSLAELITLIATTMPDDASVVLTDQEAADQTAYILKMNNFPDGAKALTPGDAKDIAIVKPGEPSKFEVRSSNSGTSWR
jgi:mono/diheme cytochrome c family protein